MHKLPPRPLTVAAVCVCLAAAVAVLQGCGENAIDSKPAAAQPAPPTILADPVSPAAATSPAAAAKPADQPVSVVARSTVDGVTVTTLSNGLTVIIKTMRTAPVVNVSAYVRAGGMTEGEFLGCGLSHLLEHLVADDATHEGHGPAEGKTASSNRVSRIGGQANAYTSMDHTCYYISATADKADQCIDLVADWIARPKFTEDDFNREHGVVQRELEKGKDETSRQMWYAYARNVFPLHPAAVPTIGFAEPLAKVTWAELKKYHNRMYVPQNVIFVIVGDINSDAALERARKAFADFKAGRQPDISVPPVRPFAGIRRVTEEHKSLKEAMESLSFQSISLMHEDLYALDVLAYILGEGRSSRLYRSVLREQKLVTSVSCSSWTPAWGKGAFNVRFRSAPDKAAQAETAIMAELKRIVDQGPDADELQRAKRQKTADHVHSQQTAEGMAGTLASDFMATGDVGFSRNYTARIQAVTAEQVHQAARQYLTFDRYVVTRLVPDLDAVASADSEAAAKAAKEKQFFRLSNGLRVILQPADSGLVSMVYVVKGGLLAETARTNGLGTLAMALSTRGTTSYTAKQIDEFFDAAGGSISGNCGNNSFYWQASVLSDGFDKALDIFAEVINAPAFDEKELEILRPRLLAGIKSVDENPFGQLSKFFRSKFFVDSPYGMMTAGTESVVAKAGRQDVTSFITPARAGVGSEGVLAIYGGFDASPLRQRLEKLFGTAAPTFGQIAPDSIQARKVAPEGELHVLPTQKKQAAIMVAAPGMRLTNDDRFAMAVLDTIISGYQLPSGWMHEELRGKELVYVVHSYNMTGLAPGAFLTYAICSPETAPKVVGIIKKNLARASSYTPSQDEIDTAVNTILTADILGNQKLSDLAMASALDELYGQGHDFRTKLAEKYRAVTPADVLRVGAKYLSGGLVVTVTTPKPKLFESK